MFISTVAADTFLRMTTGFRGPVLKYIGHCTGHVTGDKFSYSAQLTECQPCANTVLGSGNPAIKETDMASSQEAQSLSKRETNNK